MYSQNGIENAHKIPCEIILICCLFYGYDSDEWDKECIGEGVKLINRTLSKIK